MVLQDATADRHVVLMHRYGKEQAPHGFWYNGTVGCISLWPTESGEVATSYSSRPYHIFPSQMFYHWQGGLSARERWLQQCHRAQCVESPLSFAPHRLVWHGLPHLTGLLVSPPGDDQP